VTKKNNIYYSLIGILFFINLAYYRQVFIDIWMKFCLHDEYIIVSLTTTPHRINKIQNTLQTILAQNAPIKKIYLSIPHKFKRDNLEYHIPKWISDNKKITIIRTEDYGPATKLLGVLEQVKLPPDAIIITVDDDVFYPKHLILNLAYRAKLNPNYAIGIIGANPDPTNLKLGLVKKYESGTFASILQGYAGVAYRARFFDNTIFNILQSPPDCIKSDDLYLSFHLAKRNIPRQVFRTNTLHECVIGWDNPIGTSSDALHVIAVNPADKHRACISFMKQHDPNVVF